jgi:hypothetical protein
MMLYDAPHYVKVEPKKTGRKTGKKRPPTGGKKKSINEQIELFQSRLK